MFPVTPNAFDLTWQLLVSVVEKYSSKCCLVFLSEMLDSSNLITFNGLANSSGYDTFLLDEERGRLLVGAEDHIFSFDLVNINRDHKQVWF